MDKRTSWTVVACTLILAITYVSTHLYHMEIKDCMCVRINALTGEATLYWMDRDGIVQQRAIH